MMEMGVVQKAFKTSLQRVIYAATELADRHVVFWIAAISQHGHVPTATRVQTAFGEFNISFI
jgi:hypothetical protein